MSDGQILRGFRIAVLAAVILQLMRKRADI